MLEWVSEFLLNWINLSDELFRPIVIGGMLGFIQLVLWVWISSEPWLFCCCVVVFCLWKWKLNSQWLTPFKWKWISRRMWRMYSVSKNCFYHSSLQCHIFVCCWLGEAILQFLVLEKQKHHERGFTLDASFIWVPRFTFTIK